MSWLLTSVVLLGLTSSTNPYIVIYFRLHHVFIDFQFQSLGLRSRHHFKSGRRYKFVLNQPLGSGYHTQFHTATLSTLNVPRLFHTSTSFFKISPSALLPLSTY